MSKHSSKYKNIKAQLKSDEELLRSSLVKTSQKFEKKWYSRLLGISLVTALIGLGYLLFRPQKNANKKIKNKDFFNLKKYVHSQLKALNIKKIDIINKDTFNPKNNFFSARRSISRNENDYGRNISVIMIN